MHRTGDHALDELLCGGIVEGSAVLVHGQRGSGKTRLVTRWATRSPCLFVHAELSANVAAAILNSTGANLRACWLYPALDGWQREAKRLRVRRVVLDSVSMSRAPAYELRAARAWAQQHGAVVWAVMHENARGRAKGGTDAPHMADYEIRIEACSPGSGVSRVRLVKSRLGPGGAVLVPLVPGTAPPVEHPEAFEGDPDEGDEREAPASEAPGPVGPLLRLPKRRTRRPRAH